MKKYISFYMILSIAALLCSCDKMFAPKTTGEVPDDRMWMVPDMAQGVLMQAYSAIPDRPDTWDGNFLDAATDNAVTNSFGTAIYRLSMGTMSSTNNALSVWNSVYSQFQNIHIFLAKGLGDSTRYVPGDEAEDAAMKSRLFAEAMYLRAWWGAYLLQFHGGRTTDGQALGYPIVTEYVTPEEAADFSQIRRNTYEECVSRICLDCDAAAEVLPAVATDSYIGRATSIMAEFLKARVLFYAACPAYQPSSIVRIDGMGDYTVVDEEAYNAKWLRAAVQAQKVLDLLGNPSYVAMKRTDLVDMDQNNPTTPSHFMFRYYYSANGIEGRHFPPYYYGKSNTTPSQNLVDAYPMKGNGYPITDKASGYDPQNPYEGRDDRLEATVYHHGSKFGEEDSCIDITDGGKDSESFDYGGNIGSRTGYYLHKHLSEKAGLLNPVLSGTALHFYPTMRTAEIFLCLAEAANEVWGPEGKGEGVSLSAYEIIKDIRAKSGGIANDMYIEEMKGSKDGFRELILNERRLEFAFENFRFWDLRRRLLPLSGSVMGIVAEKDDDGNVVWSTREVEKREFNALRYYYLPVPYDECRKNPGMVNNMDY
ncbi:MAG: RagB/SusD family nutrient uptake outer membrane protein [Clostridium sp.]|nr:RagB/SusD family nutrient uptake outer membrane protein [Bacteroides sp.]MCM1197862.1 RagB/SusD family nutrient uptake outer membrane protein [Clostridium sp.]